MLHRFLVRVIGMLAFCMLFLVGIYLPKVHAADAPDHIPDPDPVAELAAMKIVDGGQVNLFASDPDIAKPVQMNFDCDGNLWVATSETYPQVEPGKPANDKIVVLRDTTGDGVADRSTVFADGLLIPTAVMPDAPHAAYVADSTQLLYLTDRDGDGVADDREVVLSGFGTEDTHHLLHTLRWGPDGYLYFNQSIYIHSHLDTPDGTRHLDGGGIWRFHPPTRSLEVFCKGFINPWGHIFDANGESLVSDGAFFEGINYTFPDAVFVTSPGATRWMKGLNPGSPKHCGLEIVSGNHVPPSWQGSMITSDFRSHRVCRFEVKPSQAGFISRQQPEPVTSAHVAFRPIDARMGPDGAIYIADWYNPIIQHGEVDFRDPRRDRTHGRIWRLSFPDRPLDSWPKISGENIDRWISLLEHHSLTVRQFARAELWRAAGANLGSSRTGSSIADDVAATVRQRLNRWATESPATRTLETLWFGEAIGDPDESMMAGSIDTISSGDPLQAGTMLRSLWRSSSILDRDDEVVSKVQELVLRSASDSNPRVRREAVIAAGQMSGESNELATRALQSVLAAGDLDRDANIEFAIWQSLRSLASEERLATMNFAGREKSLAALLVAVDQPWATEIAIKQWAAFEKVDSIDSDLLSAIIQTGSPSQLGDLVRSLLKQTESSSFAAAMAQLIARTSDDKTIPANVGQELADADVTPDTVEILASAAATWNVTEAAQSVVAAIQNSPLDRQPGLIRLLGGLKSETVTQSLSKWSASDSPEISVAALAATAQQQPWLAAVGMARQLASPRPNAALAELPNLLTRKGIVPTLVKRLTPDSLSADVAKRMLRMAKSASAPPELIDAIRNAGGLTDTSWKLTPALSKELITMSRESGSAARGEAIYRRSDLQCIVCHAIGGGENGPNGGEVGPNLISIGGSAQPDYIVESLLAPSAKLKEGYSTKQILTFDGEVLNGIAIGEDTDSIRLRLADGKQISVLKDDIEIEKPGQSLMPAGLLDALTKDELADLISFLSVLGRLPQWSVSTEPMVRSFETLNYSREANRRLNRTSVDVVAGDEPVMTWRGMTSRVSGQIPIDELDNFQQHKSTPPTSFMRFAVTMPEPGTVSVEFPIEGIEAWVDGRPTPVWELERIELAAGNHVVVLAIDRTKVADPFSIMVR